MADNSGMASYSRYRMAVVGRWVVASPEGPLAVGTALALLAMVEVGLRGDPSAQTGMLLGWSATMPLALARSHLPAAVLVITVANALTMSSDRLPTAAGAVAQLAILYVLGRAVIRRATATTRDATRQAMAETLLEHAARGERARIARELHDVVAHHISMIAVQAETARLATPGMPDEGIRRLLAIGDTARAALTEMRRLLGVLREDAGPEPSRAPQPGLHQLNELLDEARDSARASTRLIVRGRVVPLDPGVELTAYRIVQEALTNARRHAPGAAVDVELEYADDVIRLRIRDNGPGGLADATGHGLLGMRERATMVGGSLSAGPAPVGGFVVDATLPTKAAE
jgi:signal transduction histidine kinase